MGAPASSPRRERAGRSSDGWAVLILAVATWFGVAALFVFAISATAPPLFVAAILATLLGGLVSAGFFTLQPNEAAVLILFGAYCGSVRTRGLHWVNPFVRRVKISLRARRLDGEKLTVNDRCGNPIETAAVVVWRVQDTAQASFDVDGYEDYVHVQRQSPVRHLATAYADDDADSGVHALTPRAGGNAIAAALREELQARFDKAGVVVEEARITHLAYAPETAQARLRRQQAEAVVAARQKIVHGAVGMVESALHELSAKRVVNLDDERRAAAFPMATIRDFGAPQGPRVRGLTALPPSVLLATIIAAGGLVAADRPMSDWRHAVEAALGAAVFAGGVAWWLRVVGDGVLEVRRSGRVDTLALRGLVSVVARSDAMRGSSTLLGNEGGGAIGGRFRNSTLGLNRAFAANPARAVVLRWPERAVVVTPDRPAAFGAAVRRAARAPR